VNLIKAFVTVSGFTLISRILGLIRDIVTATIFGAGPIMDAFFAAFRLPNTLRRFTAEGALTQAAIPVYKEAQNENPRAAALFAGELIWALIIFLAALTLLVVITAPQVITTLAPGLEDPELAAVLLKIAFPYIVFISTVAMLAVMLNANGYFAAPAAAPILLNTSLIAAALWGAPLFPEPVIALAWGVFAGGLLQLLLVAFAVRRTGLRLAGRPHFPPTTRVRRALKLMLQGALGAGATQINLLINLLIASLLPAGSISWLYYADRLMELPAGLLGAALATVILPALSSYAADEKKSCAIIDGTLRLTLALAAPAAVGMALLAVPVVNVLFLHGAFSTTDAAMTAQAVVAYSIGVVGLVAIRPLAAAFFSRQDAATPAKTALLMLVLTQGMNAVLIFGLNWNHSGLALSISLGACLNATALWYLLKRRKWHVPLPGWRRFFVVLAVSLSAMAALLWLLLPTEDFWRNAALPVRLSTLAGMVISAAGIYLVSLHLGGVRLINVYRALHVNGNS
jgi:putative peptidoglycan lipid II flippase